METSTDELAFRSIGSLIESFRMKELTPVDIVHEYLSRIEAFNQPINAFVWIDPEGALKAARESEARWIAREPFGPLDGVPFSVKDNIMVMGAPFRRGSRTTPDVPAQANAPMVARCLEAGAIYIGATTLPEFGAGPVTTSPLTGVTTNPWDTSKHAGGSSGGAAASVAAGFCAVGLGTDAGGSIRIPAALTGTVGFKCTAGRVPAFPPSSAGFLSCPGPITRTVKDIALVMNLITKPDRRDLNALPPDGVDYLADLDSGIKGVRVALSLRLGFAKKVHPHIAEAISDAAARLHELGAIVEEADPDIDDPIEWYLALFYGGYQYFLRNLSDEQRAMLSPALRSILDGPTISLADYLGAMDRCRDLSRGMQEFHSRFDLLITPTVAAPAFDADRAYPAEYEEFPNRRAWTPFTSVFNLTQQPAITIPIGVTPSGLPIGMQLIGPRLSDALVIRAAHTIQSAWRFGARPRLSRANASEA